MDVRPTRPGTREWISSRSRQLSASGLTLIWMILGVGCANLVKTTVPISTITYPWSEHERADLLVVFLPGRGDKMEDFERRGFLATMRAAGIRADAVAVGAHLGYYYQRSIVTRLDQDVLGPARERGYRRIVIVGISLGGLGAILCARDASHRVDGIVLLSPYLGDDRKLFDQIVRSGGPSNWATGRAERSGKVDDEIWTFLGKHITSLPPTYLCYGYNDYLRPGQETLAQQLPRDRVLTIPGAHNWKTWETLWKDVCTEKTFASFTDANAPDTSHPSPR